MAEITGSADGEGANQLLMRCAHPQCRAGIEVHPGMDKATTIHLGSGWYVNSAGLWYCPRHRDEAVDADSLGYQPFTGGGVREAQGDRARFELLVPLGVPFDEQLLTRCAVHMAKGAEKYASRNWEAFSDQEALDRARSSALRHLFQWVTDTDDGEDHAAAVVFNLMAAEHVKRKLAQP